MPTTAGMPTLSTFARTRIMLRRRRPFRPLFLVSFLISRSQLNYNDMSKKTIHTLILIVSTCMACTKVVKLPLRTAPAQYVIEGNITDQPGPYLVRIFQTTAFYDSNNFK